MIAMGISKDVTSEKMWNIDKAHLENSMKMEEEAEKQETLLRSDMEKQVKKAMLDNEFEIFLQPKINSIENEVCGAEALIRWRHPKQGILPPVAFIPKLEKLKLTHLLDYFAFKCVCEYQTKRLNENLPLYPISSNLSLHSLANPELINSIETLVTTTDIPKGYLILEVTESAFVSDIDSILANIKHLQSLGIKISMDDFGCGNSSFSQLANMPVDELKLDRSLVQNAASTVRGNAILQSIVKLAEWLEIPVIAEGMETEEQMEYLKSAGCFICQGYYFSKPLPIAEFEEYEKSLSHHL